LYAIFLAYYTYKARFYFYFAPIPTKAIITPTILAKNPNKTNKPTNVAVVIFALPAPLKAKIAII
jgi:hypothetical protein